MYDADNILDLCQIMEGGGDPSLPRGAVQKSGCWKIPKLSCFRNPVAAHEIGKKIQALNHRLVEIEQRSSRFGFISQASNSSSSYYADKDGQSSQKTSPAIIRSDVVGEKIEEDTKKLVNLLVKKTDAHRGSGVVVVAVTGAGGIGKTTLARMVFNDSTVLEIFDKKIWLSVNKEVSEIAILQSVVSAVGGTYNGVVADKALLEDALKLAVRQQKFLLVMDDVWSDKVWNELLRVPLDAAATGSRVLVTTRNGGVARGMRAHHVHQVDKLAPEDSWSLLKKQVVLYETDESEVDVLKDVGIKIVEKCDGLPLAVKVVGGLLLNKRKTRDAWMDVLDNIAWSITGTNGDLNKAIYVSYEELPPHLKQCLLYCSLLPKEDVTNCGVIFRMWMAQGFVQNNTSSKLTEDLGLEYYRELLSRNLLESGNGYYDDAGCTMHDVVRSFAHYVAKNEGLLLSEGQDVCTSLAPNLKLRHLSISRQAIELGALQAQVSLRTLLLFKCTQVTFKDLNYLRCLRVLLIIDVNLVELPESISHLKHLRYLGLQGTSISTIPQGIGDLTFLQVIDFAGTRNLCQLPESILKLQKLRFIRIDGTKITSVPCGFGKLKKLVEVIGFPTHSDNRRDSWCSLEEVGPLSELRLLTMGGLEKAPSGSMAARAKLSSKLRLLWLNLTFTSRLADNGEVQDHISMEEKERMEGVLANLHPPPSIQGLTIIGYIGHQLPQWMTMMSAFESLRLLELSDYACCQQLPNGLGQLHFLDRLLIKRAPSIKSIGQDLLLPSLGGDCVGRDKAPATAGTDTVDIRQQRHHISHGAGVPFRKLVTLSFEGMLGWREWQWEEHVPAMPALEKLWIANCKLSHLPHGLAYHARALRVLDLRNVSRLVCVEGFLSIVELWLLDNLKLERVANNPMMQRIYIIRCPKLKVLEDLPSLRSIEWKDLDAEALPDYLREAKLNKLCVDCSLSLLKLISLQDSTSEWGKIQHVQQLKAIGWTSQEDQVDRHIYYTKEPYSFETNIDW